MVRLQAEIKDGFLNQLCEGAKRSSATLRETFLAFQAQIYTPSFSRGKITINTSGSGQSVGFEIGVSGKQFTQENVFAFTSELLRMLAFALADTTASLADDATQTGTDALYQYISNLIFQGGLPVGVTEQLGDFSNLNTYATGTAAGFP